ncbi:universal stress protein [Flagellimonas zhangzhouensis]|uniref:Nucleotide-binding universal stress protein, UspA family n=1 Tax=Flagellimonas zhangzhouensis TaxID=1073328 RepID=A0A1H2QEJ7_9FLAO|nr:universal stress protein [Allomuricauda zhangzhouensis]SDQ51385.1 Nucleotide-binding universal stress protein, UspA family [Allomuricauda zhangzhouensis]SDW04829.1 Nucleotide-binding universal stress protein, UspA family [Allomuricauda zhangzhouensis]
MKKIRVILPTDFSKNAWNAVEYALTIFKDTSCDFFILNSYQIGASGLSTKMAGANSTRLYNLIKEESERELAAILKKVQELDTNPEHTFKTLSIADSLVNAIGKVVYREEVDYVIIGTTGASGLKEVFMGSNTYKIIKEIDFCPVIAVPADFKMENGIKSILLATGYDHLFEAYELQPILNLAKHFTSKLYITHVGDVEGLSPEQQASQEALKNLLSDVDFEIVDIDKDSTVTHSIQKMVEGDHDIDLLVMINHGRGFFERLTREPVIKKVSFNSQVPFLVIDLFK